MFCFFCGAIRRRRLHPSRKLLSKSLGPFAAVSSDLLNCCVVRRLKTPFECKFYLSDNFMDFFCH